MLLHPTELESRCVVTRYLWVGFLSRILNVIGKIKKRNQARSNNVPKLLTRQVNILSLVNR